MKKVVYVCVVCVVDCLEPDSCTSLILFLWMKWFHKDQISFIQV